VRLHAAIDILKEVNECYTDVPSGIIAALQNSADLIGEVDELLHGYKAAEQDVANIECNFLLGRNGG